MRVDCEYRPFARRVARPVAALIARAALVLLVYMLTGCARFEPLLQLSGIAQGTTWHVSLWKTGGVDASALQGRIEAELVRLDESLSNYRPDSTIERFNAQTSTNAIPVGAEIVTLIETARKVSNASMGCYDLTIKPLVDLWGFSADAFNEPDASTLARVRAAVGFQNLHTLPPLQLRKGRPDLRVDLASLAQGYSVGRLAAVLERAGIDNYLVEIGGDLQTRGHKPDGSAWRVGLERPLPGGLALQKTLTVRRERPMAIMTSGTYHHFFDVNGKRYSHILDARSGTPVAHDTVSVTVIHDDPTQADAWSTALMCLGQQEGRPIADAAGIAALFISARFISGQGDALVESASRAWQTLDDVGIQPVPAH